MSENRFIKQIPRLLVAALISFCLFAAMGLGGLLGTLFHYPYLEQQLKEVDYPTKLVTEINRQINSSLSSDGFPNTLLEAAAPREITQRGVQNYFKAIYYADQHYVISGEEKVQATVGTAFREYYQQKGVEITPVTEKRITMLTDQAAAIYHDFLDNPTFQKFMQGVIGMKRQVTLALAVLVIVIAGLTILLSFMLRRFAHRLLRYLSYAFMGAGLGLLGLSLVLKFKDLFDPQFFAFGGQYQLTLNYVLGIAQIWLIIGTATVAVGALMAFISESLRSRMFRS